MHAQQGVKQLKTSFYGILRHFICALIIIMINREIPGSSNVSHYHT